MRMESTASCNQEKAHLMLVEQKPRKNPGLCTAMYHYAEQFN